MKKVVFLGDSLTNWFTKLDRFKNVINMGVAGDKTIEIIGRLNAVTLEQPDQLFLMVGINDFTTNKGKWGDNLRIPFLESYHLLLHILKISLPKTQFIVQAMLPLGVCGLATIDEVESFNKEISNLNKEIEKLAKKFNMKFIDFSNKFKDENKRLKQEYTIDGVHLSDDGYEIFYNEIKDFVLK